MPAATSARIAEALSPVASTNTPTAGSGSETDSISSAPRLVTKGTRRSNTRNTAAVSANESSGYMGTTHCKQVRQPRVLECPDIVAVERRFISKQQRSRTFGRRGSQHRIEPTRQCHSQGERPPSRCFAPPRWTPPTFTHGGGRFRCNPVTRERRARTHSIRVHVGRNRLDRRDCANPLSGNGSTSPERKPHEREPGRTAIHRASRAVTIGDTASRHPPFDQPCRHAEPRPRHERVAPLALAMSPPTLRPPEEVTLRIAPAGDQTRKPLPRCPRPQCRPTRGAAANEARSRR